jgi:dipeptidyl aminopeptidase/acylaminoacyl peptidase
VPGTEAAYPGGKGNIAVVERYQDQNAQGGIFLRLLDSKGRLTRRSIQSCAFTAPGFVPKADELCPSRPDFSRRGRKLAFSARGRLAISDADGSSRVLLPRFTEYDNEPAWTRGARLLFTGERGGRRNIYLVNSDGTGLRRLTGRGGRSPAYSSRGLVAYAARGYVRLLRPDGSGARRFARGSNPDFSPSGRTIVYDARRPAKTPSDRRTNPRLYVKSLRRGSTRRLVTGRALDPVFSPDGRRILFVETQRGSGALTRLSTVSPSGRQRRSVFQALGRESGPPNNNVRPDLLDPAWQPRR